MDPFQFYPNAEHCLGTSSTNVDYHEISCIYPVLDPLVSRWEKYYDLNRVSSWMKARPFLPISIVFVYMLSIIVGTKMMEKRDPFKWRKGLIYWNLFLSIFSFIGAFRTIPALIYNLQTLPLRVFFCANPVTTHGCGSSGLWVQLFILSKIPELVDTLFIVVHKKKLIFLHWYHHVTVLLYCWHSYVTESPFCLFFVCMNYSVHACMYGYYFLVAARIKPKWLNPMIITTFQISQMIVGVIVAISAFYFYTFGNTSATCHITRENNVAAFIMYGSYLALFLQFFFRRYFKPPPKKKIV